MLGDVYFYGELTLVAHPAPLFSLSFSQDEGESTMEELMGWQGSLVSYHRGLNNLGQGEMVLVYCQLKYIWMVRNKDKIELPFTSPFSQAQLHSSIPSSSISPPLQVTQTDGSGGLWSVHSSFSCFSVGSLHGLQFFRTNLFQHELSINHSSFIKYPHVPEWVPPWATVQVSALVWYFPWAAGEYLLWPLEHLLSPFFSHPDAHGAASHTYFSSFLSLPCGVLLFLVFPEVPTAWQMTQLCPVVDVAWNCVSGTGQLLSFRWSHPCRPSPHYH